MTRLLLAAAVALVLVLPARAAEPPGAIVTGRDLAAVIAACATMPAPLRAQPESERGCGGYQAGVVTGLLAYHQVLNIPPPFCLPRDLSEGAIDRAIAAFIARDRNVDLPAALVVIGALAEAFPCAKPRTP